MAGRSTLAILRTYFHWGVLISRRSHSWAFLLSLTVLMVDALAVSSSSSCFLPFLLSELIAIRLLIFRPSVQGLKTVK